MRLKLVRKASCRTVAKTPTATISAVIRTSGNAPLNLPILTPAPRSSQGRLLPRTRPRAHDRLDDPALPELVAGDLVDDLPARHHDDAVAEAGELERVARLDDGGDALLRLLAQRVVDVEACRDVDALRRLLGEDDLDVTAQERSRQRDLLLIPARERLHRLLDRRRPDAQAFHETVDRPTLAAAIEEPETVQPPQHLDRRVGSDAQDGEERFGHAVAAQQHDPRAERPDRRARVELLAVAGRRPRGSLRTCERPEELHLAVALRARDSDDLAARHLEVDRPEPVAPKARDREEHLAPRLTLVSLRKRELERTPDHERDEALLRHRGRLERPLAHAVAENADPVGDAEDLGQPVADVDDPDAGAAPLVNQRVETVDVLRPEGRRRLVEEQHLRLGEQCLDDLEELSLRERQRPRGRGRRDVEVELGQPVGRPSVHASVRRSEVGRCREVEVLGHRQVQHVRVRLIGDAETEPAALGRRHSPALGLADDDGALVGSEEPAGDVQQRRFPGPVLPDEGVDLAGTAVDADLTKRLYRTERLGHASQREHGGSRRPTCRREPGSTLLLEERPAGETWLPLRASESTSFAFCCFRFLLRVHLLEQAQRDQRRRRTPPSDSP